MDWTLPGLTAIALVLALACHRLARRVLVMALRGLNRLAARRLESFVLVGGLALALAATITLTTRWPVPGIHDEYSYLLAGQTFAAGRLTNPPHPLWEHFESFHILVQPTYMSKYPPMQGMILAAGLVLGDHAIFGVWLANAAACMTVYWMLLGWLPRRWALLGGLLAALHPLVLEWGQCYWGGAAAMLGGALVGGAVVRLGRRVTVRNGLLLGLGLVILANSRPFEGMVYACGLGLGLLAVLWQRRARPSVTDWGKLLGTTGCVLAGGAAAMAIYNYRGTGDPTTLPYSVHEQTYSQTPLFVRQAAKPAPEYRHQALRDFWGGWALEFHRRQQTWNGYAFDCGRKLFTLGKGYLWKLALAPALLPLLWSWRSDRRLRWLVMLCAGFVLCLLQVSWPLQPHYAAPMFGVFLLLLLEGMRRWLAGRWHGHRPGAGVTLGLLLGALCAGPVFWKGHAVYSEGNFEREAIIRDLTSQGGLHLIVVRYGPEHNAHDEWVFNDADIPESPVVWARDMGPDKNRRLFEHFERRQIWLLEPDIKPATLVPHPARRKL